MTVRIVTRAQWGATASRGPAMALPSRGIVLHHSVTKRTTDSHADMRVIEGIGRQRFGRFSYSWAYHLDTREFLEGAGNTQGAHTSRQNSTTHGLVLIGNFDNEDLPDYAVADIAEFIRHGYSKGWWAQVLLGGHRDTGASTACPGRHAHARIPHIRTALTVAPKPTSEDDMARLVRNTDTNHVYQVVDAETLKYVANSAVAIELDGPDWENRCKRLPGTHPLFTLPSIKRTGPKV